MPPGGGTFCVRGLCFKIDAYPGECLGVPIFVFRSIQRIAQKEPIVNENKAW